MKTTIRNVIFDFGNVILDLDRDAVVRCFAEMGVDVNRFLGMSKQQGIFGDLELGLVSADEWVDRVLEYAPSFQLEGKPLTLTKQGIIEAWNLMVKCVPLRRLQALEHLRKHYHISMLSNTNELHTRYSFDQHFRAQGYEPEEMFEHIFLSNEMHMCKPHRDIFEETLRRSGYLPEETLFVDDSEENCKAFAELGVQTFCPKHPDEWLGLLCPAVASIGFFDGVHQGHQYLIRQVQEIARERQMNSLLISFYEHPRAVLQRDYVPQLLTSSDEKLTLLKQTGVDRIEMLHFTPELSRLTAREYMQQVLHDQLGVRVLVMGYDHRFGHDGGTLEQYQQWGREVGIEVLRARELPGGVSSSAVRRLLSEGDVAGAAQILGHPYTLSGPVVRGFHVGHELGFPTANLNLPKEKMIPQGGAYAVWVTLPDGSRQAGMLNIGMRPTVDNGSELSVEVNLLDFIGDLYDQYLSVELVQRLRSEVRFASLEELKKQLQKDCEQTRELLR